MDAPSITIDGITLNDTFYISDIRRPFPTIRTDTTDIPGRDGTYVADQTMDAREVSFRLWLPTRDHGAMLDAFGSLIESLGDGTHSLVIGDEGGRIRTVRLDGDLDFSEYDEAGCVEVRLLQPDPYCTLPSKEVTVAHGQTVRATLEHANPWITIHATGAVRNATTNLWGLVINSTYKMHVKLPSAAATDVLISYEGLTRKVEVNGSPSMITKDSDWPTHMPKGRCEIRMDASAAQTSEATITITERCL